MRRTKKLVTHVTGSMTKDASESVVNDASCDGSVEIDPVGAVRKSCAAVAKLSQHGWIAQDGIRAFAAEIHGKLPELRHIATCSDTAPFHDPAEEWRSGMGWQPASLLEEVNAHATLHLLNIGHGYKHELRCAQLGRYKYGEYGSAYVTMLEGVGRAAKVAALDTACMIRWTIQDTNHFFHLQDIPVLAAQVTTILSQTGAVLAKHGHKSLGSYICMALTKEDDRTASRLLRSLIAIPAFADRALYSVGASEPHLVVHFYKKAQLAVRDLALRFGHRDERFRVEGIDALTACADNVLPAVLRAKGVICLEPNAITMVAAGPLPPGGVEVALRALAVEACERLVLLVKTRDAQASRDGTHLLHQNRPLTAIELDLWIWGILGKEAGLRDAVRHYTPDTIFY